MKKIEIFLKNLLLRLLLLSGRRSTVTSDTNEKFDRILLIRLNRIGDALITTPLISELRKNLSAKIYMLADKKNYFVFNNNNDVDKVIVFQKGLKGIFNVYRFIRSERIDTVVDLHDDISTTVSYIISISGVQNKFGLQKDNKNIYTKTIKRPDPKINHVIIRILQIARLFSIEPDISSANVKIFPSESAFTMTSDFLKNNLNGIKFLIGINISSGSEARYWGTDKFKALLEFLSGFNCNTILLSSPHDEILCRQISDDKFTYFISERYDNFAAMISKLNLLITPDTAAVHIASAFKIPVFGLYVKYNTDDMIWSPFKSDFDYVLTEEPTLKNISFKEVSDKLEKFLKKYI